MFTLDVFFFFFSQSHACQIFRAVASLLRCDFSLCPPTHNRPAHGLAFPHLCNWSREFSPLPDLKPYWVVLAVGTRLLVGGLCGMLFVRPTVGLFLGIVNLRSKFSQWTFLLPLSSTLCYSTSHLLAQLTDCPTTTTTT